MFFNNLNLIFTQQHLCYKIVDKMRILLMELLYSKIT